MRKFILWMGLAFWLGTGTSHAATQFTETFDALGEAHGEFGLDDASSVWWPGEDDPALITGGMPPACDPAMGGTNTDNCTLENHSRLVDLGNGDWAFYHVNWAFSAIPLGGGQFGNRGSSGILSKASYQRGDNIYCVFQTFGDPAIAPAGEPYPLTGNNFGPWMIGNTENVQGWGTNLAGPHNNWPEKNIELGTSHWIGWKMYLEEGGGGQLDMTGPELAAIPSTGFRKDAIQSAMPAGTSYAQQKLNGSFWTKATLGNTTGGKMEYCLDYTFATATCNDAGGWRPFRNTGGGAIDTIGDPMNSDGGAGTSTVGGGPNVHLGFSSFKHAMYDNITVVNDSAGPPAPNALRTDWTTYN